MMNLFSLFMEAQSGIEVSEIVRQFSDIVPAESERFFYTCARDARKRIKNINRVKKESWTLMDKN
jgi:hypothetical protein